jgi:hypothetical protein
MGVMNVCVSVNAFTPINIGGRVRAAFMKGKGKVVPVPFFNDHNAMKAYWGSGDVAPRIH